MRLGKHQIDMLRMLVDPGRFLIVGDKTALSLAKRGLVKARSKAHDSFYQITPAGLHAVADLWKSRELKFPGPSALKPKRVLRKLT